jgi:hypothetical protein
MRNGVVPGLADGLDDAFRISLQQGIITHYGPMLVLCCEAQVFLIEMVGERPTILEDGWLPEFRERWTTWIAKSEDAVCAAWRKNVHKDLDAAWKTMGTADWDPDTFNPFDERLYRGGMGYVLLTLQIGVWAAAWAKRKKPFPHVPPGFPHEVFERSGPWTLAWVAMIGYDSDTYGATAGPMIAAACGGLPEELTEGLEALQELRDVLP